MLVEALAEAGARRIDMNLGCPFVPQVRKGRGAGMLCRPESLARLSEEMGAYTDKIDFSIKMRLGVSDPAEAMALVETF